MLEHSMIIVVEKPASGAPAHAWFAYDAPDLLRKLVTGEAAARLDGDSSPAEMGALAEAAETTLSERGEHRIYTDAPAAMAAFERVGDPFWEGQGWRARLALREQLIALEVLADDL